MKRRHRFTFLLMPSKIRALDLLAKRQEISRAELIRRILLKAAEKHGKYKSESRDAK